MTTLNNPLRLTAIVTSTQEVNDVMEVLRKKQSQGYVGQIMVETVHEDTNAPPRDCVSVSLEIRIRRFGFRIGARVANKQFID